MKRTMRHSMLFVLVLLILINSSCKPANNYKPGSLIREEIAQNEPAPQKQSVAMQPQVIFDNINTNPNSVFPPIPPTFTLTESWHITSILVMHWNHGKGAEPGEITILNDQDNVFGTWQAEGVAPEPQFPNTYWVVRPDRILEPGTYIIYDSDPETQSYNAESDNMGMVRVKGFPSSGYLNTAGIDGIVSIDTGSAFSSITYTENELAARGETKDVSPQSPKALVGGVTVDFGGFNLDETGTLEVAKLPDKEDKSSGVQLQAFNITLGDIKNFPVMLEITLPYDPGSLTNAEETYAISVGWYDESQKAWKILPGTVNNADNTVTFRTDHLTIFAVINNEMNKGSTVFYYKDHEYLGPNTPVLVDSGALKAVLNEIDRSSFDELIRNKSVPTNEFFSSGAGIMNDSISGLDYLKGLGSSSLQKAIGNKFIALGAVAVAVKMTDQWSRGVSTSKIIRDNAFDLAELAATGVLLATASPYVGVAVAGLWMAGMVDDYLNDEVDIKTYMDGVERAYDQFNLDHITYLPESGTCGYRFPDRGEIRKLQAGERTLELKSDWGAAVSAIYESDKKYPSLIQKDVNALVTSYCNTFWEMPESERYYWVETKQVRNNNNEWVGLIPEGKIAQYYLPWPEDKAGQQVYKNRCVIRAHNRLQPLYEALADKAVADLWTEYYTAAFQLADQLNQTMYFEVIDPALNEPGFAKSSSANKVLVLQTNGKYGKDFYCKDRYKDTNLVFSCNLYHYINAGMPNQMLILPEGADEYTIGEPIYFIPEMPITKIHLVNLYAVKIQDNYLSASGLDLVYEATQEEMPFPYGFKAIASPAGQYRFVWDFGNGLKQETTGQESIGITSYTDFNKYTTRVTLYDMKNNVLATDEVSFTINELVKVKDTRINPCIGTKPVYDADGNWIGCEFPVKP